MKPVTLLTAFGLSCLIGLWLAVDSTGCASSGLSSSSRGPSPTELTTVRLEIERWYEENTRAFRAKDLNAIMALRTEDFHTVTPDGVHHDRAAMEQRTQEFLNGVQRWIALTFDIDSLEVSGDLAVAIVRQHLDRMALRSDGRVHQLQTWVTQRETWRRTPRGWKMYRVDSLRDQRRLIDGQPG